MTNVLISFHMFVCWPTEIKYSGLMGQATTGALRVLCVQSNYVGPVWAGVRLHGDTWNRIHSGKMSILWGTWFNLGSKLKAWSWPQKALGQQASPAWRPICGNNKIAPFFKNLLCIHVIYVHYYIYSSLFYEPDITIPSLQIKKNWASERLNNLPVVIL